MVTIIPVSMVLAGILQVSAFHRRDAEKIFFSAAKLAKMRKIKKTKKTLFFALFAFFAAKDILKSFHCVSARRPA
jgi:hypothetical protein